MDPPKTNLVKRKHVTLNIQQKQAVLNLLDKGVNRSEIMEKFQIRSSTIYDLKKKG